LSSALNEKNMSQDRAETGRLEELLARVGAGLDQYLEFDYADAVSRRESWSSALEQSVPQQGVGIDVVVNELMDQVVPNGSSLNRPGFTAFITTGGTSASTLASTAASVASPQRYTKTAFNLLEELSLDWLAQMFGLGEMKGIYSSGGSVANLIALGAARQSAFEKVGRDPGRDGVDRPVSVYASGECHNTIQRSGGVLGIGRRAIKPISCDDQGRMLPAALRSAIEQDLAAGIFPMAIVANAGTTNTGAIDPLAAIGAIAREFDIWFHIDGAYGLPGVLDERLSQAYRGLTLADSVIVDPHKWLGAAVGVSATFVRDRSLLERAFTQEAADYLEGTLDNDTATGLAEHSMDDFGVPYFSYGTELSDPVAVSPSGP
jgi:aromatic-L-amino-acid decarboxylase